MKKSKISKLMALLMVVLMALTACTTGNGKETDAVNEDERVYTIGISQLVEHAALDDARQGFIDGLEELGVKVDIKIQNAQGEPANAITIAEKFVKDKVDLIYAIATPSAQAARQVSTEIPVLFSAVTDPVTDGIVDHWDNVGGNVTGTSDMADTLSQLKMFKEIDPSIKTIGILYNTSEDNSGGQLAVVEGLAPEAGLEVVKVGVNNVNDLPQAIDSLLKKVDALYALSDNMVASAVELVSKKLIDNKIISVSTEESQVKGGLLITEGFSYYDLGKQTAQMAKEILVDGKDIKTIPVGKPAEIVKSVNAQTMKALGLDENIPLLKEAVKVGE